MSAAKELVLTKRHNRSYGSVDVAGTIAGRLYCLKRNATVWMSERCSHGIVGIAAASIHLSSSRFRSFLHKSNTLCVFGDAIQCTWQSQRSDLQSEYRLLPPGDINDCVIFRLNIWLQSQWNEGWNRKYTRKSTCLPMSQVQRLGRQILEALLFLRERGFPSHGHLHTGNVILQNGVARWASLLFRIRQSHT